MADDETTPPPKNLTPVEPDDANASAKRKLALLDDIDDAQPSDHELNTPKKTTSAFLAGWKKDPKKSQFSPLSELKNASIKYIHFHVNDSASHHMRGFAITCDGFAEKALANALFEKKHDYQLQYLMDVDPVGFVYNPSVNGEYVYQPGKVYKVRSLVVILGPERAEKSMDEAFFKNFFDEVLLPHLKLQRIKIDNCLPVFDPVRSIHKILEWSARYCNEDCIDIFRRKYVMTGEVTSLRELFIASKYNLYALWPIGGIPPYVIRDYQLTDKHLHPKDRLPAANNNAVIILEGSVEPAVGENNAGGV